MKKSMILLLIAFFLMGSVSAVGERVGISWLPETGNQFVSGQNIRFKVELYDSLNNPIQQDIQIILENAEKTRKVELREQSNKLININLSANETGGDWFVLAKYGSVESNKEIFSIRYNEFARFEISGDSLIIYNTGNIPYTKDVQVLIGDTVGTEKTNIPVGGNISYRLLAPDGVYSVKVSVDGNPVLTQQEVALTGEVIGVLDERIKLDSSITGINIGEDSDKQVFGLMRKHTFQYIFIAMIVCVAIILFIESRYRKLAGR